MENSGTRTRVLWCTKRASSSMERTFYFLRNGCVVHACGWWLRVEVIGNEALVHAQVLIPTLSTGF